MRMVVDLPAPFGPEEADDLARGDAEAHMIDGGEAAEALDQAFGHDPGASALAVTCAASFASEQGDEKVLDAGLGGRDLLEGNAVRRQEHGGARGSGAPRRRPTWTPSPTSRTLRRPRWP